MEDSRIADAMETATLLRLLVSTVGADLVSDAVILRYDGLNKRWACEARGKCASGATPTVAMTALLRWEVG